MRTTIDLPDDLHRAAMSIARDQHKTLSQTVALLMRQALHSADVSATSLPRRQGVPLLLTARQITIEDVRGLDDDE